MRNIDRGNVNTFSVAAKRKLISSLTLACSLIALSGCVTAPTSFKVPKSRLETSGESKKDSRGLANTQQEADSQNTQRFTVLESLGAEYSLGAKRQPLEGQFSDKATVKFAVENMPTYKFVHHVFGDVLGVNYVMNSVLAQKSTPVTLNFQQLISPKHVFLATSEILLEQKIGISKKEGVFYLYPLTESDESKVNIGIGKKESDIPVTTGKVLQIIPLDFGVNLSLERTLNQLTKAKVMPDFEQSALFVEGTREEIKHLLELVNIMDIPSNRGKFVGLIRLTYLSTKEFASQVTKLLENEGIPVGSNNSTQQKNVVLVPIEQIGLVAVFSTNEIFLNRVQFWQEQIDQPGEGTEKCYFMYQPKYARARDLGESLSPLFGGAVANAVNTGNSKRDTKSAVAGKIGASSPVSSTASVGNGDLSMVVDERTNTLIFHTTGKEYQTLLPLVQRMDTLPKQVFLEATIAEVTLTDEFKHGVEFAISDGNFSFSTDGAFKANEFGGLGLGWAASQNKVNANFFKTNSLVNVLSNPTQLVRDGVTASITVGNEVPIITGTTSNPLNGTTAQQTQIERRQTGLTLSVTPTINAQGVVIMEIDLESSNQLATSGDDQKIFTRQLSTEVVAQSGQTIILGGLISHNNTTTRSEVPGAGSIPLLGNLFSADSQNHEKTELVILVTPKIINDENQWSEIKNNFGKGLENVEF